MENMKKLMLAAAIASQVIQLAGAVAALHDWIDHRQPLHNNIEEVSHCEIVIASEQNSIP